MKLEEEATGEKWVSYVSQVPPRESASGRNKDVLRFITGNGSHNGGLAKQVHNV